MKLQNNKRVNTIDFIYHYTIFFVILPSAQKMIFAGLRLGVSGAFIGIVLAELLITPTGIGDLITYNRFIARYDKMFATIVSILVIAALTLSLMRILEDWLFPSEKQPLLFYSMNLKALPKISLLTKDLL